MHDIGQGGYRMFDDKIYLTLDCRITEPRPLKWQDWTTSRTLYRSLHRYVPTDRLAGCYAGNIDRQF